MNKKRKSAYEIVNEAFDELKRLNPTPEEIDAYAELNKNTYGVVTYSNYKRGRERGGDFYFLRFHDTWKKKFGGRVHIDIGYVDEQNVTTHLMLDKYYAPDFVKFIKKRRGI